MNQEYKVVACNNKDCGDVGQWDDVLGENLSAGTASQLTMSEMGNWTHCWFCKQEVENYSDYETAYLINYKIDYENSEEFKMMGL